MIRVRDLWFGYGGRPVLRGLDLAVPTGSFVSVLGPNGCGKSTLLRLVRGLLAPDRGEVLLDGAPVRGLDRRAVARRLAVVPQAPSVPFPYPVRELVAMGRFARSTGLGGLSRADRAAVERALALTDTLDLADRRVTELSGGEVQRVVLARALAQESPLLVLDEATSHLDVQHRLEVAELLLRLNRDEARTIVQVTHDLDLAGELSDRVLLLSGAGEPVAVGAPDEVFTPDALRCAFGVPIHVDPNPFSGAPRLTPVVRRPPRQPLDLRVHVVCGGGSGAALLRRLALAGARVSAGPLNRGDTDLALARVLGVDAVEEEPFCPVSPAALAVAAERAQQADVVVVGPVAWGQGNRPVLALAEAAVARAVPVFVVDPTAERDFTGGAAWADLQALERSGARVVDGVDGLLAALQAESGRG